MKFARASFNMDLSVQTGDITQVLLSLLNDARANFMQTLESYTIADALVSQKNLSKSIDSQNFKK